MINALLPHLKPDFQSTDENAIANEDKDKFYQGVQQWVNIWKGPHTAP